VPNQWYVVTSKSKHPIGGGMPGPENHAAPSARPFSQSILGSRIDDASQIEPLASVAENTAVWPAIDVSSIWEAAASFHQSRSIDSSVDGSTMQYPPASLGLQAASHAQPEQEPRLNTSQSLHSAASPAEKQMAPRIRETNSPNRDKVDASR